MADFFDYDSKHGMTPDDFRKAQLIAAALLCGRTVSRGKLGQDNVYMFHGVDVENRERNTQVPVNRKMTDKEYGFQANELGLQQGMNKTDFVLDEYYIRDVVRQYKEQDVSLQNKYIDHLEIMMERIDKGWFGDIKGAKPYIQAFLQETYKNMTGKKYQAKEAKDAGERV